MNFDKLSKNRYSMRNFSSEKIPAEMLTQILEAGRVAPTAKNLQPQRILVVQDEERLKQMSEICSCIFGATTVLVICSENGVAWESPFDGRNSGEMDASIVATHMMLQAADIGVGSCWVCHLDREKMAELLQIPEQYTLQCLLVMGMPGEKAAPSERHNKRFALDKTVWFEKFK